MTAPGTSAPRWPAEAPLLRETITAARAAGWRHSYRPDHQLHRWTTPHNMAQVTVDRPDTPDQIGVQVHAYYTRSGTVDFWPGSVTSAVDVLASIGVLPKRLHSAWRAGRSTAVLRHGAALRAAREALLRLPQICTYHGSDFGFLGWSQGVPRCDSCRTPWRVKVALDAIDVVRDDMDGRPARDDT